MADYKETTISGNSWTRCNKIEIDNTHGRIPTINFWEETRMSFDGESVGITKGDIFTRFTPDDVIELRNPETMEKTGQTITQSELYAILYSVYIQEAFARDEREAFVPEPEPIVEEPEVEPEPIVEEPVVEPEP